MALSIERHHGPRDKSDKEFFIIRPGDQRLDIEIDDDSKVRLVSSPSLIMPEKFTQEERTLASGLESVSIGYRDSSTIPTVELAFSESEKFPHTIQPGTEVTLSITSSTEEVLGVLVLEASDPTVSYEVIS